MAYAAWNSEGVNSGHAALLENRQAMALRAPQLWGRAGHGPLGLPALPADGCHCLMYSVASLDAPARLVQGRIAPYAGLSAPNRHNNVRLLQQQILQQTW